MEAVNNADFFDARSRPERLLSAFHAWCAVRKREATLEVFAEFAGRRPSSALVYAVGEFVEAYIDGKTRYGTVAEYGDSAAYSEDDLDMIRADFPIYGRRTLKVPREREEARKYKCDLPDGLLDYAKAELLKEVKCPLRENCREGKEAGDGRLD